MGMGDAAPAETSPDRTLLSLPAVTSSGWQWIRWPPLQTSGHLHKARYTVAKHDLAAEQQQDVPLNSESSMLVVCLLSGILAYAEWCKHSDETAAVICLQAGMFTCYRDPRPLCKARSLCCPDAASARQEVQRAQCCCCRAHMVSAAELATTREPTLLAGY
jgi:hypothetical protein